MGPMLCHQKICLDTIWKEWPAVFFSSNISRLFLELVKSCQVQTLVFLALHLIKKLSISVNGFAVFHSLHLSTGLLSIPPPNFSLECHGEDDACLDQGDHCQPPVWYSSNDGWLWSVSRCRKCLLETFSTHWKLLKAISATENFERLTSNNFNRNWCGRTFWLKEEKTPFSPWSNLLKKWKLPLCERRDNAPWMKSIFPLLLLLQKPWMVLFCPVRNKSHCLTGLGWLLWQDFVHTCTGRTAKIWKSGICCPQIYSRPLLL